MTPRAVRPARAKKRATGLWEARLAGRITSGADTECIPVTTSLAGRQTSTSTGSHHSRLPECQASTHPEIRPPGVLKGFLFRSEISNAAILYRLHVVARRAGQARQ